MPKPRVGNQRLDIVSLLAQALGGFGSAHPDGLANLAVNNRYRPNPRGLSGVDLMKYWSSLDPNTPDKMNVARQRDIYRRYPNSQYATGIKRDIGAASNGFLNAYFNANPYGDLD